MSSDILLKDDEDAMFGDGDEEEEEEDDVDMAVVPPAKAAAVKQETSTDVANDKEEEATESTSADINGDEDGETNGVSEGAVDAINGSLDAPTTPAATLATPSSSTATTTTTTNLSSLLLPTSLPPMPSPFPHHNSGPTSDRLRNAMSRIASNPTRDAEAWQALITEAQSCWRSLGPSLYKLKNMGGSSTTTTGDASNNNAEVELIGRKLDWIEACYGALIHYFPYAVTHYVQLVEMLSRLSAVTQDEEEQCGPIGGGLVGMLGNTGSGGGAGGGAPGSALSNPALTTPDQGVAISPASLLMNEGMAVAGTERQKLYDVKLDKIFQLCLGVTLDGSTAIHNCDGSGEGRGAGKTTMTASSSITAEDATLVEGARTVMGGLAQHSMDLWLLYIRKRYWDAARSAAVSVSIPPPPPGFTAGVAQQLSVLHQQYEESLRSAYRERKEKIRELVTSAYETALDRGAGFAQNNHLIWKRYVNYVKSWTEIVNYSSAAMALMAWLPPGSLDPSTTVPPSDPAHDHSTTQKQLSHLRGIYQRGITHPMTGLDQFWQEYEVFERSHSESLGSVLIAEWLPKYQHARSIYLERNRVWTMHELKIMGRLAVPPVGCEGGVGGGDSATVSGMGMTPRAGAGAAAGLGADDEAAGAATGAAGMTGQPTSDAEYIAQMEEERSILSKWRRRVGYERTNPERLSSSDHAARVRASYCEEVCAFARHPEVWYEWSQWELLHGGSTAAAASAPANGAPAAAGGPGGSAASAALIAPAKAGEWRSGGNAIRAIAVLSLGMESLPDSAFLAEGQADILERHLGSGKDEEGDVGGCIKVLERFVSRSPTTLGFVLLQRLVRRHEGIGAARSVFSRARRTLHVKDEDMSFDGDGGKEADVASSEKLGIEETQASDAKEKADGSGKGATATQQRMVTSRLKASVGATALKSGDGGKDAAEATVNAGYITWHLYAAHATIEHRLSKNPKVAARIYELGLRKHRTFLSNPPYVLHYANLLLELNDEENLRSLLMRAVAACEEEETTGGDADATAVAKRREMQRPLWDMMLKFESVLSSGSSNGNVSADVVSIEARRRRALYGPGNEDVVMGGEGPPDEDDDRNLGTGVQKSSLNEQLVRVEGYDTASRIANGLGRLVDILTVTGAIGNGESDTSSLDFASAASASLAAGGVSSDVWSDECAGGPSDISYVKRLKFQRESRTRAAASALGLAGAGQGGIGTSGKLLSARERAAGGAAAQATNIAIQNSPEWLRPLLLLLPPVPKFGRGTVKPPPHLTEMALSALRSNALPSNRPVGTGASRANNKKRGRDNDGDSSDDEDNMAGGGYSNQFRSRQRSRLVGTTSS